MGLYRYIKGRIYNSFAEGIIVQIHNTKSTF
jgi:hypothetical protein